MRNGPRAICRLITDSQPDTGTAWSDAHVANEHVWWIIVGLLSLAHATPAVQDAVVERVDAQPEGLRSWPADEGGQDQS